MGFLPAWEEYLLTLLKTTLLQTCGINPLLSSPCSTSAPSGKIRSQYDTPTKHDPRGHLRPALSLSWRVKTRQRPLRTGMTQYPFLPSQASTVGTHLPHHLMHKLQEPNIQAEGRSFMTLSFLRKAKTKMLQVLLPRSPLCRIGFLPSELSIS